MPSTEQLPSGRHRGIYYDGAGKRQRVPGTFATQKEAFGKAAAEEEKAKAAQGPSVDSRWARTVTVGELCPDWQAARRVEAGTASRDDSRIRNHVLPRWGGDKVRELDTAAIEDWVHVSLIGEKGLSPSMAIKCYWNLSSLCEYAKARGALDTNPCKGVKLPDLNHMPAKFIEDEAHTQIRRTLPEEFQDVLDLLDETGLRPGELQGLHVENVDLRARTLDVVWSFDASSGQMKELKDKECRTVPIADKACKILARRINAHGWGQPAPVPYKKRSREVESGLVLAQPNGRPYSDSEFRKSLRASARIAYVGKGKARHNVGRVYPYLWRHRYAKRLLMAGVSIDELAVLMGHASIDITKKWYGHLGQSGWDSIRAILDAGPGAVRHCPTCECASRSQAA
ncbi:tyrosine-type recombinase/integrase [Nocardia gipuzkoensis]